MTDAPPQKNRRALTRRDLLLGAVGASSAYITGCTQLWRPAFSDDGWFNAVHTRCIAPARVADPTSLAEIVQYVRDAEAAHVRVRAVGAGHSFSDVAFADGWLLRTLALDRTMALNPARMRLKYRSARLFQVEAGIRLRTLNQILVGLGLALPDMGGWDHQTLAGAISTSTHGSGLGYGPLPSLVVSIVMVTAGGRVVQFERTDGLTDPTAFQDVVETPCGPHPASLVQNDEAFRAALVNMGSMGVTYSLVFEVVPSFWTHEERLLTTWEDLTLPTGFVTTLLRDGVPERGWGGVPPDFYEIAVNPYKVGKGHTALLTRRTKMTKIGASFGCVTRNGPLVNFAERFGLKHPYTVPDLINDDPETAGTLLDDAMKQDANCCYEAPSFDVFNAGPTNDLPAYSVELSVDFGDTVRAVQFLLGRARALQSIRVGVHSAPVSIRFVKQCDGYLSPQYRGPTCTIEILTLLGVLGTDAMLLEHEHALMKKFGARPHWGLDLSAIQGKAKAREIFSNFDAWVKQYRLYNASGVFDGEVTDRLGISTTSKNRSYRCLPEGFKKVQVLK